MCIHIYTCIIHFEKVVVLIQNLAQMSTTAIEAHVVAEVIEDTRVIAVTWVIRVLLGLLDLLRELVPQV